ncbi:hypothetical protein NE236_05870 [Actinoallomurus purpureus]|uniref:hypothetical protein n=1 Tax=Actinoallomurus purpureus TaxID=478114 RepID=UPI0020920D43|nr:hypothetical protein [Actinoallomurus purpureus]MCO6004503.1 hypothetical protein [Actinoallomurus purpureus]
MTSIYRDTTGVLTTEVKVFVILTAQAGGPHGPKDVGSVHRIFTVKKPETPEGIFRWAFWQLPNHVQGSDTYVLNYRGELD